MLLLLSAVPGHDFRYRPGRNWRVAHEQSGESSTVGGDGIIIIVPPQYGGTTITTFPTSWNLPQGGGWRDSLIYFICTLEVTICKLYSVLEESPALIHVYIVRCIGGIPCFNPCVHCKVYWRDPYSNPCVHCIVRCIGGIPYFASFIYCIVYILDIALVGFIMAQMIFFFNN